MNYFYVYQNKTYHEEKSGGFLWSPKFASGWKTHPGYETMKQVKPGDIIFHSYSGEIVAISKAETACYSYPRPGRGFEEWDKDGWRIDTRYFALPRPLKTAPFIPELYRVQPPNGPFTAAYRGKQQYLCNVNTAMFNILIDKIVSLQPDLRQAILDFVECEDAPGPDPDLNTLKEVEDNCTIDVLVIEKNSKSTFVINTAKYPNQKAILGKKIGDTFTLPNIPVTYRIDKIYREND